MTSLSVKQSLAIKKLEKLRVGALFMEPGTGKTRTALELINGSEADWVLWVVPFSTKANLQKEIDKWGCDKPYEIIGVETIAQSDRQYLALRERLAEKEKVFMVVDESLKIKNIAAKRTERTIEIGKRAYYRLILNGTPLSRNVLDLWSQMEFLSPKILKMSYQEFRYTFSDYIERQDEDGRWSYQIMRSKNEQYLYALIEPYVFNSRLKIGVQSSFLEIQYDLTNKLDAYYSKKEEMLQDWRDDANWFLRMTQAMQHEYTLDDQKFWQIRNLVDEDTVIFCKFVKARDYLAEKFPQAKVLTYGTGAFGLNLQAYKKMIFWDKTFDYAQLEQAQRRIYRVGQTEDVRYYMLTADVGLEHLIDTNINKKTSMLDAFKLASEEGKGREMVENL
ncbi:MAG: SNF2-related protein [Lactobacillus sp.]|jgi:SNF2 family DNA or RNA helicase|nr:SNF2-related protein [Lactobacillus sp.]MCI2032047.1 SNF2-related protein [Lactobacillus sp.]